MYDKQPKMKRDTRQKSSPFPEKKTAYLSEISLHFRPFVAQYGFTHTSKDSEAIEHIAGECRNGD